jgi:hypothetical protein
MLFFPSSMMTNFQKWELVIIDDGKNNIPIGQMIFPGVSKGNV